MCLKKHIECEKAVDALETITLDQPRVVLEPEQIRYVTVQFTPKEGIQGYYPAKIILQCEKSSYQIPLLGIGTSAQIKVNLDGITNVSDEKLFVIE